LELYLQVSVLSRGILLSSSKDNLSMAMERELPYLVRNIYLDAEK
jgi:hypothetical protein